MQESKAKIRLVQSYFKVLHALQCIIYELERKEGKHLLLNPQAPQAQVWVRASEVIW